MSQQRQFKPAVALIAILVLIIGLAVGVEALVSDKAPGPDSDEYAIVVMRDGERLAAFTVDELREDVGFTSLVIQGRRQDGPRLRAVLEAAGVSDFERILVSGMGVRDSGSIVLQEQEVTDEVLLDVATRGTVKVVGPDIDWNDRVRDVTEIVVE